MDKEIRKYRTATIMEHWLFLFIIFGLMVTAFPGFINWFLPEIAIYDVYMPVLPIIGFNLGSITLALDHRSLGLLLSVLSLFHIIIHFNTKDESLITSRNRDLKIEFNSLIHSLFYFLGLFRTEESGGGEKIVARQRAHYLSLLFTIGLLVFTGLIMLFPLSIEFLSHHTVFAVHILAASASVLIIAVHVIFVIRNHDLVSLKTIFLHGKVPLWYIKKKKVAWFYSLEKDVDLASSEVEAKEPMEKISVELFDFYEIRYDNKDVQMLTEEIKKEISDEEKSRLITVAESL